MAANDQTLSLKIQPVHNVLRDLWANRRYWLWCLFGILCLSVISSGVFWWRESGQLIDERPISLWDCLYFTITNMTTVGSPESFSKLPGSRWFVAIDSVVGVLAFGFWVATITIALQPSELKGGGTINKPDGEHKGTDTDTSRATASETFLSSLKALTEQSPREQPIRLAASEGNKPDAIVEVIIVVHHPREIA